MYDAEAFYFVIPHGLPMGAIVKPKRSKISDACTACRRSKVRCEEEKPCSRCLQHDWEESCVGWRKVKAARTQEATFRNSAGVVVQSIDTHSSPKSPRNCLGTTSELNTGDEERTTVTGQLLASEDKVTTIARVQTIAVTSCDKDEAGPATRYEATEDWSDEVDDFRKAMELLKAVPVPEDHPMARKAPSTSVLD